MFVICYTGSSRKALHIIKKKYIQITTAEKNDYGVLKIIK